MMSTRGMSLPLREPRQEQPVRRDVFPIRNLAARNFGAVPPEHLLQFLPAEPFLPLRSFQPSPLLRVLIDDHDPPARSHHAAELRHRAFDIDGVLERFGGIST